MGQKLIDGNVTIEDKASPGLSAIEKVLKDMMKELGPVIKGMSDLNKEISKFAQNPASKSKSFVETSSRLRKSKEFGKLSKGKQREVLLDAYGKDYSQKAKNVNAMRRHYSATSRSLSGITRNINAAQSLAIVSAGLEIKRANNKLDAEKLISQTASYVDKHSARTKSVSARADYARAQKDLIEVKGRYSPQIADDKIRVTKEVQTGQSLLSSQKHMQKVEEDENKAALQRRNIRYARRMRKEEREERKLEREKAKAIKEQTRLAGRSDWQKRMSAKAAAGGKLAPLWESLSKATSPMNVARSPHLVSEGLMGVFGNLGRFGKGVGGFATGRLIGGLIGGSAGAAAGGLLGSAAGGLPGLAIGAVLTALKVGFDRVVDAVRDINEILSRWAEERAFESTSLRRKMQMSHEMFGVNPRDVEEIDKKLYAYREIEQNMYRHGISGRDVSSSAIEWLHLLGTKESGGTFADEKEAFDFSQALSTIAKMNGLSQQEYETVRYQGMQILSKGYADILDVKPLLNSAPGFVRDLLQQTGMTRKEFLEAGRNREDPEKAFTADKFINALKGVQEYYEVLSDRMSSRTAEQQTEAAEAIIASASVWDEMYNKTKAEYNQKVANATLEAGLVNDMKESFYQMWSSSNDAQDGIVNKVKFEKDLTGLILKGVTGIWKTAVLVKNMFDSILDLAIWIGQNLWATLAGLVDTVGSSILGIFGYAFEQIGSLPGLGQFKEWGEAMNPWSTKNKNERFDEDFANNLADMIYEDYQKHGAQYVQNKYKGILDKDANYETIVAKGKKEGFINSLLGRTWEAGASFSRNVMDHVLYGTTGRKDKELFQDKRLMVEAIKDSMGSLTGTDAQGNRYLLNGGLRTQNAEMSSVNDLNFKSELGMEYDNAADYTPQARIKGRFKSFGNLMEKTQQEFDDVDRTFKNLDKALEDYEKQAENLKAPYVDKKVGNIDKNVSELAKGKGNSKVLEILKEIAGITVINKVTRVRPDVVFNYGSYGRYGAAELPNARAVGNSDGGQVFAAATNAVKALTGKGFGDRLDQTVNGVPTLDSSVA